MDENSQGRCEDDSWLCPRCYSLQQDASPNYATNRPCPQPTSTEIPPQAVRAPDPRIDICSAGTVGLFHNGPDSSCGEVQPSLSSVTACANITSQGNATHSGLLTPISDNHTGVSPEVGLLIHDLLSDGYFERHCHVDDLMSTRLNTLAGVSTTCTDGWTKSTIRMPVVVSANGCYATTEPTPEQLWQMAFRAKRSKKFVNGEESVLPDHHELAMLQYSSPNGDCPISIIGMEPPKTSVAYSFNVPESLNAYVTAHEQRDVVYNLTPSYTFVDLHIDYGADGISKTLGQCEKYWFLFPPTAENLRLLAGVHGEKRKLGKLLHALEFGIIAKTKASDALYIPSGCIHATYTTKGGFLVAKDFVTMETCGVIAMLMRSRLFSTFDNMSLGLCLEWFVSSLVVAVHCQRYTAALKAWVDTESILRKQSGSRGIIHDVTKNCFDKVLRDIAEGNNVPEGITECPCGRKEPRSAFEAHWRKTHLNAG
jgi:hypothetical protein